MAFLAGGESRTRLGRSWVGLICVAICLAAGPRRTALAQQPVYFFKAVDIGTTDLTEKQARVLARLQDAPTTVGDVQIVSLEQPARVAPEVRLAMDIAPDLRMEIRPERVERRENVLRFDWRGPEPGEAAVMSVTDMATTGLIVTADAVYSVEPLGDGLQAVAKLDQSKFHQDEPPEFKETEAELARPLEEPAPDEPAADTPPITITVLVAYTPAVDNNWTEIPSRINGAVALTNATFANSNVNAELELVHFGKVDYTERGTHRQDLDLFRGKADPEMREIHELRDEHKADICVLLIDDKDACGLAAEILAQEDTAFVVVHYDCAIKNLSFPHEIGHLLGARHNPEKDPTVDPNYPFNHGYLNPGGDWRTVMAYYQPGNRNRIPYWSNPNVVYGGDRMGTAAKHNNALMLNRSARDISRFR